MCSFPFYFWFPFYANQNKSSKLKKYEIGFSMYKNSPMITWKDFQYLSILRISFNRASLAEKKVFW